MVIDVGAKDFKLDFLLSLTDSFDHESLIVSQEEKASTLTRSFARLKHLLTIKFGGEAIFNHLEG